jgi:Retroviral aspartyl protease.
VSRYRYNQQVEPPAPFALITLLRPLGDDAITDLPAQLDTAADRTVVPSHFVEEFGLIPLDEVPVLGFGGIITKVRTCLVRLSLRSKEPVALKVFVSGTEPHILLGRDILNGYRVLLDGPRLILEID